MKNEKTFTIVLSCQLYWGYGKLGSCQSRKNLTTICCCIFLKRFTVVHHSKKRWSVKGKKLVVADLPQIFKFPSHFLPVSTWVKPRTKDRPVQLSEFTIQNTLVETKYFWSSLIHLHIFASHFCQFSHFQGFRNNVSFMMGHQAPKAMKNDKGERGGHEIRKMGRRHLWTVS